MHKETSPSKRACAVVRLLERGICISAVSLPTERKTIGMLERKPVAKLMDGMMRNCQNRCYSLGFDIDTKVGARNKKARDKTKHNTQRRLLDIWDRKQKAAPRFVSLNR